MDRSEIAIATMTLARSAREGEVLLDALQELARAELPIFVTDGGSGADFVEALRRIAHVTVCGPPLAGLWPQMRRSLEAAGGTGCAAILYTEPDKKDFFRVALRGFIRDASASAIARVVLAARSAAHFATFPPFQQYTESVINRCCSELIGPPLDYIYGPFLLPPALVQHLTGLDRDIGWGWRTHAFGVAHRLGMRVEGIVSGCACPHDQREDAERVYRMLQLSQSLKGLVLSTKVTLAASGSSGEAVEPEHR